MRAGDRRRSAALFLVYGAALLRVSRVEPRQLPSVHQNHRGYEAVGRGAQFPAQSEARRQAEEDPIVQVRLRGAVRRDDQAAASARETKVDGDPDESRTRIFPFTSCPLRAGWLCQFTLKLTGLSWCAAPESNRETLRSERSESANSSSSAWYPGRDSNPHAQPPQGCESTDSSTRT